MAPTLTQFRYFRALAETGNFGRAARRLHMSQPPLSRQIAALEADLGIELFERTPKGVVLTAAGTQLLADSTQVLQLVDQASRNATATARGEAGQLTMGFTMSAAYSVVPSLTRRYQRAFPNVQLRVREMMPNAMASELRDGGIDVAISFADSAPSPFETQVLLREPLQLVLPEQHPLARTRKLKVESLKAERFLITPRAQVPVLYDAIVQRCEAAGFTPLIGLEVYLQQTIVNFVAEGLGIAMVPASMRRSQIAGARFRAIDAPPVVDQVLMWSGTNRNPCLAGFLATCREQQRG
jgi:DNA-binding transcriptional LysR family regulator